jgi:hypothetical protein
MPAAPPPMITISVSLLLATLFLRRFERERHFVQAAVGASPLIGLKLQIISPRFQKGQRFTVPSLCSLGDVSGTFSHPYALTAWAGIREDPHCASPSRSLQR